MTQPKVVGNMILSHFSHLDVKLEVGITGNTQIVSSVLNIRGQAAGSEWKGPVEQMGQFKRISDFALIK